MTLLPAVYGVAAGLCVVVGYELSGLGGWWLAVALVPALLFWVFLDLYAGAVK